MFNYDIRTPDLAYETFYKLMPTKKGEFLNELICDCNNDFDVFINKNTQLVEMIDLSQIHFIAFHVTTSRISCADIKRFGLCSLRKVLSEPTDLREFLNKYNLMFSESNNTMTYNSVEYDIDYSHYENSKCTLKSIAHKYCYDPQVNAFWACNDVTSYGTDIHKHPEFFIQLEKFDPIFAKASHEWEHDSETYILTFYANFEQLAWFTLYDSEQAYCFDKTRNRFEAKCKLLKMAYARMVMDYNDSVKIYMYVDINSIIYPEQIIHYKKLTY